MTPGEQFKFFASLFNETKNRLAEIIAARDDTVHVVFLILHGTEQNRILQIHHLGNTAAFWAKQFALRRSWALDHFVGRAEKLAE